MEISLSRLELLKDAVMIAYQQEHDEKKREQYRICFIDLKHRIEDIKIKLEE